MMCRSILKKVGVSVAFEALAKALTQLTLAQTAVAMCDECLADDLTEKIQQLTAIKARIARGVDRRS